VELRESIYRRDFATSRIFRNALLSSALLVASFALAQAPDIFDRPVTRLVNTFANRSWPVDYFIAATSTSFTFTGALLMALIWYCWFVDGNPKNRARLLVGTLASLGAGVVSRFLQHSLSTHPRPYYDPALGFHRPLSLEPPSNTWDSFPSDHVAVYAGLAILLYIARPTFIVYVTILWTIIVESFRTYMGAHYPSDLIAGAALAGLVVWTTQSSRAISVGEKLIRFERSSPGLFYFIAFFMSYQIATLFVDARNTLGPVRDRVLHHDTPAVSKTP
jgi:membrane-associated phospholipid phosphatase